MAAVLHGAAYGRNVCHRSIHVVRICRTVICACAAALGNTSGNPLAFENLAQGLADVVEVGIGVAYRHKVPIARLWRRFAKISMLTEHHIGVHKIGKLLAVKRRHGIIGAVSFGDNHRRTVNAPKPHNDALLESAGGGVVAVKLLSDKELVLLLVIAAVKCRDVAHARQGGKLLVKVAVLCHARNAQSQHQEHQI